MSKGKCLKILKQTFKTFIKIYELINAVISDMVSIPSCLFPRKWGAKR